jgi:transcription antitermination factor NusG
MSKQKTTNERRWYVLHTYSGYEDAVAKGLKQRIESLSMDDKIFNVIVPKEKKIKIKNGKKRTVEEKIYPGYVLVEMIVTDDSWYVVRNTPNVTGFVLIGRGIYALREWGYTEGQVRDVIMDILRSTKNPLTKEEVISLVSEKRIVKKSTILLNLQNKKVFSKDSTGKYKIRES